MLRLGLIGGMSWESTAIYYRHMNEIARARLGKLHSADLVMRSFDFAVLARLQHAGDWDGVGATLAAAARELEAAGAAALVLCTNTMHLVADRISDVVSVPLIHITDVTAQAATSARIHSPALLATKFTMEGEFYRGRLRDRHGIETLVPDAEGREAVHRIIYEELCKGAVRPESKRRYLEEIERLRDRGADGLILGCTEITLLIGQQDCTLPVLDTTWLHAKAAMDLSLADEIGKPDEGDKI